MMRTGAAGNENHNPSAYTLCSDQNADCTAQPSITIEDDDDDGPTPNKETLADDRGQNRPAETNDGA